ncbi:MAG: type II secretion system F family protein [Armatimonadetes bacterium]|nr:type II secretion system F family protein [Armatimonadota bacterium]
MRRHGQEAGTGRRHEGEVTNAELATFCRQFASLMHAKVNILEIFDALREQSDNPYLREIIDSVRQDVEMGRSLATAFSRYPTVFSPFFISMVRQGELEGELDRIFDDLADHYETRLGSKVDATRRRDAPVYDWEAAASAFQWLFTWFVALVAVCLLASGLTWYATSLEAIPGAPVPNAMLVVSVIMLLGVLVFTRGRKR